MKRTYTCSCPSFRPIPHPWRQTFLWPMLINFLPEVLFQRISDLCISRMARLFTNLCCRNSLQSSPCSLEHDLSIFAISRYSANRSLTIASDSYDPQEWIIFRKLLMFIFSDKACCVGFMYNHSFTRYHSYPFSLVTKTIDGAKQINNEGGLSSPSIARGYKNTSVCDFYPQFSLVTSRRFFE